MSKIRVLSDQLANQIAAGEVVERPASVAKELVENSIDAGARRITVDVEGGGRKLLRVADDGEGMTRDDALLAFERHATSKISSAEDLHAIRTLGFRGEALASIASVARIELVTKTEEATAGTRILIEGGRVRDVKDAAHPRGTTITMRDLFFNVPARRKFLRSEATEVFHLTNLVTHYALAHPEIAFAMTNNGRETLRATPVKSLRERAYQIFGAEFLDNLLEVNGGHEQVALVRGFISAPLERRTSRDAQYLFINGRYVRDRLISRALSEGYRAILPNGVYPAALLFLEVPLEEVDVNVHPAKTEVRFRRAAAVADAMREAVRTSLAHAGYVRTGEANAETGSQAFETAGEEHWPIDSSPGTPGQESRAGNTEYDTPATGTTALPAGSTSIQAGPITVPPPQQNNIEFGFAPTPDDTPWRDEIGPTGPMQAHDANGPETFSHHALSEPEAVERIPDGSTESARLQVQETPAHDAVFPPENAQAQSPSREFRGLPPLGSAVNIVRDVAAESLSTNIRPVGQLEESYIIATDDEGLLLMDQHHAHERILFDKYRALEASRLAESQHLLIPETFDLTPAQAAVFDHVAAELEAYGFGLMRLSGRTVAIKSVPADLPAGEARGLLAEILGTVDFGRRSEARATLRDQIAIALASRAAINAHTPLAPEKMRWLIDRLLNTSSPTTCPHGQAIILRLTTRDIEKSFRRG